VAQIDARSKHLAAASAGVVPGDFAEWGCVFRIGLNAGSASVHRRSLLKIALPVALPVIQHALGGVRDGGPARAICEPGVYYSPHGMCRSAEATVEPAVEPAVIATPARANTRRFAQFGSPLSTFDALANV